MEASIKLYSFSYKEIKTYLFTIFFVAGNLLLPQLCHLIPSGGIILLPIYFFTLIAAYKYGIQVGLLTAILSPIANYYLFGMPGAAMLPVILIKSGLLAVFAALAAQYFKKLNILILLGVVLAYQVVGTGVEWLMLKDFTAALQDFRLGLPGMAIQIVGGYFLLKALAKF